MKYCPFIMKKFDVSKQKLAQLGIIEFLKQAFNYASEVSALASLTVLMVLMSATLTWSAQLQNISWESLTDITRVVLHWDGQPAYYSHVIPRATLNNTRYYLDFESSTAVDSIKHNIEVGDRRIKNIRIGEHNEFLRVVLDLQPETDTNLNIYSSDDGIILETKSSDKASEDNQFVENEIGEDWSDFQITENTDPQFSVRGRLFGYTAQDLNKDEFDDDYLHRTQCRVGGELEQRLSNGRVLKVSADMEYDRINYAADEADEDTDIGLYEAYMILEAPVWELSLGKQRIRWGKSDQLSPLDSLNPDDLRQFITLDLEERKEPSWSGRFRAYGETFTLETVVSPWFEESEFDYFDSDWAIYRNLRQSILNHPGIPPELKNYAAGLRVHEKEPTDSLENMSAAVRLLWKTEQADFALSYSYAWETLPTIESFPVKNINYDGDPETDPTSLLTNAVLTNEAVEARFERQKIAGFEWETVIDMLGFRGEVAYIDQVSFLSSDLTSKRRKAAHLVTGIDYTSKTEWYLNLQASWYRIFDYTSDILYFEQDNVALLGEISKPVWRGNIEFSTRYNYTITDGSSYLQPSITLKYFTNTELEAGVNIFSGSGDTLLGSYDHADQAYVKLDVWF